ncbi:hypothetical protein [Shewanella oncorhynchi]
MSLNVSTCELQKLEKLDIKKINAVDISRLQQTLLSTDNKVKQQHILKLLNKVSQHNESGVHILSPEKSIALTPHIKSEKVTSDDKKCIFEENKVSSDTELLHLQSKEMIDDFIFGFSQKKTKPDIYALLNQVKFEQHTKPAFDVLSSNERDAINFYIGNRNGDNLNNPDRFKGILFSDLNSYLRGYEVREDIKVRVTSIASDMYSGLMKLPSGEKNTISYRAIDAKGVAGFEGLEKGDRFFDFASMSSSENQDFVRGWFKTRMANYPVNEPAVFILKGNPINTGALTNKSEVIYPSGTKFEIIHSDTRNVKLMDGYERMMKFFVVQQSLDNDGLFIDLASGRKESSDGIARKLTELGLNH